MDPEEMKQLHRRQRRKERREARKAALPTKAVGIPVPPRVRLVTEGIRPVAPASIDPLEYEMKLAEAMELPLHGRPEDHTWLGFSLAYIQRHFPSPGAAAAVLRRRVQKHGLVVTHVAILPGIFCLGPIKGVIAPPQALPVHQEVPFFDEIPF